MLDAVKAEYIRRGSPMSYTGWDIPSVRKFMTARMNRLKKGEEVGVYAKDLPKRRSPHNPAPLPSWALSESEDEPEAEEEESEEEEEDDGLTDSGYAVQKAKNKYYLVHRASRQKVEIGDPEPGQVWEITAEGGVEYLGQGNSEVWDEIACREHMGIILQETSAEKKPKEDEKTRNAMKGMLPKGGTGKDSKGLVPAKPNNAHPSPVKVGGDDDFGESSDNEEAPQVEESKDALQPFIYKEEESGKMYLVDPRLGQELKLPSDKSYDWEVSEGKKDDSGSRTYRLISKSKKDSDKDVACIMAGRRVKIVEHPDRLQQVQKAKDKHQEDEQKKKKTPQVMKTPEEMEKDLREKIEKDMRMQLEGETRQRLEQEMRDKIDKEIADKKREDDEKKAAQEKIDKEIADKKREDDANKAAQDKIDKEIADKKKREDDEKKAAQEKIDKEIADKKKREDDEKKAAQEKIDKEIADKKKRDEDALKARIEKETRERIEQELRQKIEAEMAESKKQEEKDTEQARKEKQEKEEKEEKEEKKKDEDQEAKPAEWRTLMTCLGA